LLGPEEASERGKGYALHLGAARVGITEISSLWIYSHRSEIFHGNWNDRGRELDLSHKYAIVLAEEMSISVIGPSPIPPPQSGA
jgi:hypothetical protein